jgi:hypothetical protein
MKQQCCLMMQVANIKDVAENWVQHIVARFSE